MTESECAQEGWRGHCRGRVLGMGRTPPPERVPRAMVSQRPSERDRSRKAKNFDALRGCSPASKKSRRPIGHTKHSARMVGCHREKVANHCPLMKQYCCSKEGCRSFSSRPSRPPHTDKNCGGMKVSFQRPSPAGHPLSRMVRAHVLGRSTAVHGGRRMVADRTPSRAACPKRVYCFARRRHPPTNLGRPRGFDWSPQRY